MIAPEELAQLPEGQRAFYTAVTTVHPHAAQFFNVARTDEGELAIKAEIPSPTGDPLREVIVWLDEGDLSVAFFSPWHVHGYLMYSPDGAYSVDISLADMVRLILSDELLMVRDAASDNALAWELFIPGHGRHTLVDALTEPGSSGAVDVRSWSGAKDCRLTIADLNGAS